MIKYLRYIAIRLITVCCFCPFNGFGQGLHVFAEAEASTFDLLSLDISGATTWTTERAVVPGYFSAVDDATFSGAADGTTFIIDGYAKYYRGSTATSESFTFPVGQGIDYHPVTISGPIPSNAAFAAAWYTGDPASVTDPTDADTHSRDSRGLGVVTVLPQGFWDWQTITGSAPGMQLTVTLPDLTTHALASSLILVGWDGTEWINLSGAMGGGPYGGNWASGNSRGSLLRGSWQSGITALGIGSVAWLLPVRLASFTGKVATCQAQLNWITAIEENTSHFIVQASPDGVNWHAAGRIDARNAGNGSTYTYSTSHINTVMYYRLLMVDHNDKTTYSHALTLTGDCGNKKGLNIFPNPLTAGEGLLSVQINAEAGSDVNLLVRDVMGTLVIKRLVTLTPGLNRLQLETASLLPGVYLLSIVDRKGQIQYPHQQLLKN